ELEYAERVAGVSGIAQWPNASTTATRMVAALAGPILEGLCLTGGSGTLSKSLWTIDLRSMAFESHHVAQRPQCPACGDPRLAGGSAEIRLESRQKRFTTDSGHRSESPWFTYERFRHHVSPVCGAVSQLEPRLLDENPLHVFASGANASSLI